MLHTSCRHEARIIARKDSSVTSGKVITLSLPSGAWRVPQAFVQTCVFAVRCSSCLVSLAAFLGEAVFSGLEGLPEDFQFLLEIC